MNQNINLYHPIFRKQAKKFSARTMLQAAGILVGATLAIYAFNLTQVASLRAQVAEAQRQADVATKRLTEVTQKFAGHIVATGVGDEIVRLEQELSARNSLQQLIGQGSLGNAEGYSEFFVAFARQHVAGLWITRLDIAGSGESMILEGRSSAPDLVPRYVQKLSQEPRLSGTQFRLFEVTRPAPVAKGPQPHYVEFRIGTARADNAAEAKQ